MEEKVAQMPATDGLLLAYHDKRHSKIYEEMT